MMPTAEQIIQRAEAEAAAYLPGHVGPNAQTARLHHLIGNLRASIRRLCAEQEPPAPRITESSIEVTHEGVPLTVHFWAEPDEFEVRGVYIGPVEVSALVDADDVRELALAQFKKESVAAADEQRIWLREAA